MNWFCWTQEHSRKIYPEYSYNWYIKSQNQQKKVNGVNEYDERMVRCDKTKNPFEFQNYIRVKIKSKDIQEIASCLRKDSSNFVDEEFGHLVQNVHREGGDGIDIGNLNEVEWKRVVDIVKNGVYSLAKKQKYESNFKINNKVLENCLSLISRTHPKKLQRIRDQRQNQQGIYQFKLFKGGIIHNVVIDDYVPTFKGYHVFTGPAHEYQTYPMLLQKAIAKICGGYSQMPKNPLQIMQMIYCGAIRRQKLQDVRNLQQFRQLVLKTLLKNGLTLLISKKDKKVRHYGINNSQIYQVINYYDIQRTNQTKTYQTLYQILSESLLSSWNGCYRITDPKWKQIQEIKRQHILKSITQNRSFIVSDKQISRIFQQLIVYQDTQTMNKDWQINYSQNGYPSFCKFTLNKSDNVFLRITTKNKIKQSMILCKIIQQGNYQLIGGSYNQNIQFMQFHYQLQNGNYIICVIHEWIIKKQGQYVIYLSSNCRTLLESDNNFIPHFLDIVFSQHSQRKNKDINKSLVYQSLIEIGFGYLRVFVIPPYEIRKIRVNHNKLRDQGWKLIEPYQDMIEIITTTNILLILKLNSNLPKQLSHFPIQAFIIT